MSPNDRRARARRKAWGRGPMILRFDPLEGRQLLSTLTTDITAGASANPAEVAPEQGSGAAVTSTDAMLAPGTPPDTIDAIVYRDPADDPTPPLQSTTNDPAATVIPISTTNENPEATSTPQTTANANTPQVNPADWPDLIPIAFGAKNNLAWGERFPIQGTIRNQGNTAAAAGVKVDVYASNSPQFGAGSIFVGSVTIDNPIAAGESASFSGSLVAPPTAFTSSPNYYFTLKVDSDGVIAETSEANNGGAGDSPNVAVQVVAERKAELVATGFVVDPLLNNTLRWGKTVQVAATITNAASGVTAPATRARVVAYPKGTSPDGPSAVTVGELYAPALPGGASTTLRGTIYLPLTAPASLAGQSTLTFTVIPDADYLTRPAMQATTVRGEGIDSATKAIQPAAPMPTPTPTVTNKPDLKVSKVQPASDTLVWGKTFDVTATVENTGKADAGGVRVRFMLVDANRPNAEPLALADAVIPPLKPGFQQQIVQTLDLSGALPNGLRPEQIAGRILVVADAENSADELNETNNRLLSSAVALKTLTKATDNTTTTTTPGTVTTPTPTPTTPTTPTPTPTPTTPTPTPTSPTRPLTLAQRRAQRMAERRAAMAAQIERQLAARKAATEARALQYRLRIAQQQALRIARDTTQQDPFNG